jgi:ankyrin repeat protein
MPLLHLASQNGYVKLAHFLVERGSDATAQDNKGITPLHWASERDHVKVLIFFLSTKG